MATKAERAKAERIAAALAAVDWARLDAMTDEEIEAAALSDPDNPPMTAEEIERMRTWPRGKRPGPPEEPPAAAE